MSNSKSSTLFSLTLPHELQRLNQFAENNCLVMGLVSIGFSPSFHGNNKTSVASYPLQHSAKIAPNRSQKEGHYATSRHWKIGGSKGKMISMDILSMEQDLPIFQRGRCIMESSDLLFKNSVWSPARSMDK
jgi:hypothetical protein